MIEGGIVMKTLKKMSMLPLFLLLFASLLMAQTLYNNGHIPQSHQETWYKAGLIREGSAINPKQVFNVTQMGGLSDIDKVTDALDRARDHVDNTHGLAIIYFPDTAY